MENADDTTVSPDLEGHASAPGAAAAGAVTGGVIGAVAGPAGAALGAVGGALVGLGSERAMHAGSHAEADDDNEQIARDPEGGVAR